MTLTYDGFNNKIDTISGGLNLGIDNANSITIGGNQTTLINISQGASPSVINVGSFGDTVNINGELVYVNTRDLLVYDKSITLNISGALGSGNLAGIYVQEMSADAAWVKIDNNRNSWGIKVPNLSGQIYLTPGNINGVYTEIKSNATSNRTVNLQDASGTLAYLTDTSNSSASALSLSKDFTNILRADTQYTSGYLQAQVNSHASRHFVNGSDPVTNILTTPHTISGGYCDTTYYSPGISLFSPTTDINTWPISSFGSGTVITNKFNDCRATQFTIDKVGQQFWFRGVVGGCTVWNPWNRIWHSGYMGHTTGLDADKLDGNEGSYYTPISTTSYLTGSYSTDLVHKSGNETLTGIKTFTSPQINSTNGTVYSNENLGQTWFTYNTTPAVANITGAIVLTAPNGWTDTMMQGEIDINSYSGGIKGQVIFTGYNFTGGGGQWINYYATINGLLFNNYDFPVRFGYNASLGKCVIVLGTGATNFAWGSYGLCVNFNKLLTYYSNQNAWNSPWSIALSSDNQIASQLTLTSDAGAVSWNQFNHGTGSGMDADYLDALHGSYYTGISFNASASALQSSIDYTLGYAINRNHPTNTWNLSGGQEIYTTAILAADGGPNWVTNYHGMHFGHANGYGSQLAMRNGNFLFRSYDASVYSPWYAVWTSNSDGTGSGLDADLLDGQHGSYYTTISSNASANALFQANNNATQYVKKSGDTMTGRLDVSNQGVSGSSGWLMKQWVNVAPTYSVFQHSALSEVVGNYALAQNNDGTTLLNSATGKPLYLRVGNVDQMVLSATTTSIYNGLHALATANISGNCYLKGQINSQVIGVAPLVVSSNIVNTNLNADMVDGVHLIDISGQSKKYGEYNLIDYMNTYYGMNSWTYYSASGAGTDITPAMDLAFTEMRTNGISGGILRIPPGRWRMVTHLLPSKLAGNYVVGAGSKTSRIVYENKDDYMFEFNGYNGYAGGGIKDITLTLETGYPLSNLYAIFAEGGTAYQPDNLELRNIVIDTFGNSKWAGGIWLRGINKDSIVPYGMNNISVENILAIKNSTTGILTSGIRNSHIKNVQVHPNFYLSGGGTTNNNSQNVVASGIWCISGAIYTENISDFDLYGRSNEIITNTTATYGRAWVHSNTTLNGTPGTGTDWTVKT